MPEQIALAVASWAGAAAGGGLTGAITSAFAYYGTYIATTIAFSYGISALAADAAQRDNPGSLLDTLVMSDAPRQVVIGERNNAGSMVGRYITGPGNNNVIEIVAIADHRVEAALEYYANGILQLSNLVHGVRTAVSGYRDKDGDRMWVTWYDGRHDQGHDANMAARTLVNQPDWTTSHRGRGVSYAIVEMQWDDDVMLSPVQSLFKVRGGRWYDRRQDTTAGGSGTQRHMDPDTWVYTANPDVFADHYQLGVVPYPYAVNANGRPLYHWGIGLKPWQLPFDIFKEEADLSDERVTMKDGVSTQARYELHAIFNASQTHKDILTKVARAKAGRVVDRGGRLAILGPQARSSVMTLYDGDLVTGEQSKYTPKLSVSELYNTFRGTFPDPAQMYRGTDFPPLLNADWVDEDGGDELPEDVDIDVDTDLERVQRLVYLHAMDRRRQARLTEVYRPHAIEIEAGDWFERIGRRFPDGKMFEAIRVEHVSTRERGLAVIIHSKEVDPDDVAWNADQAADLSRPPPVNQEAAFAFFEPPSLTVAPIQITGTGTVIPAIGVVINNATDPRIRSALIEVTPAGGGPYLQKTIEAGLTAIANAVTFDGGITPGGEYIVRARFQGLIEPSAWSAEYAITAPPDFIVPQAGQAGGVIPGSDLAALFDNAMAALSAIQNYPGFAIIGAIGTVEFAANEDAAGAVTVEESSFWHPSLQVTVEIEETWLRTPWGALYAPAGGWFGIIWSEEPCDERFSNGSGGDGHIYVAVRDGEQWKTYNLDRNAGEVFTPALSDVVLAQATKPLAPGSTYLGSTAGITEIESFVRDQGDVEARLFAIEAVIGDGSASIEELEIALATEVETRASQTTAINATLSTQAASILANSSAISTNLAAQATINSAISASFGTANAAITANSTAIATEAATRASETSTLTTNLGAANAAIVANSTAITTNLGAQATINSAVTASLGTLSSSVSTNATAITLLDGRLSAYYGIKVAAGTNVATIEAMATGGAVPSAVVITAGQISMHGAVLINGTVTANKMSVTSLDAITATIGLLRTATTGERMELASNQLRAYNSSNVLVVELGIL